MSTTSEPFFETTVEDGDLPVVQSGVETLHAAQQRIHALEKRLAAAEATIESLLTSDVDGTSEDPSSWVFLLHQLQQALRGSEQKFETIFRGAVDAIVLADGEGLCVDANPAAYELFDLPREALLGCRLTQFLRAENGDLDWDKEVSCREVALRRADGVVKYVEYSSKPNMFPGEHLAIFRDVTQRKEQDEQYRTLFENTLDGFALHEVVTDSYGVPIDFVYLEANQSYGKIVGMPPAEIIGRHATELFDGLERELLYRLGGVALTGESVRFETFFEPVRKHLEITAFSPRPGQFATFFTNIGARKRVEREREEALAQLRERVKELTLLNYTGHLLGVRQLPLPELLRSLVDLIPQAWRYPEITAARIRYNGIVSQTDTFRDTPWRQRVSFDVAGVWKGTIDVVYLEERPQAEEGPFLAEERNTLDALAGMLKADFERRWAEEEQQRSDDRYRSLFETMSQGVIYFDAAQQVITANPASERILGLTLEEGMALEQLNLGHTIDENGDAIPYEQHPLIKALNTGQPVHNVVVGLQNEQGDDYRWVRLSAVPQFTQGEQKPYQVYTMLEDITARKWAEERRYQLAAIVESSEDAIIGKDLNGIITSWNRAAEKMYGYSATEVLGKPVRLLSPPERASEVQKILKRVQQGESIENKFTVHVRKDGTRLFVAQSVSPIKDGNGRALGISTIARDITQQKRAETKMRFQAQLLDSVRESVIATDLKGSVIYWGKGASALYGFTAEEVLGKPFTSLMVEAHSVAAEKERLREALQEGSWRGTLQRRRKDGSVFWASTTIAVVRNRSGEPAIYISIDRDVTARQQYERELEAIAAVADALRTAQTRRSIQEVVLEQLMALFEADMGGIALVDPLTGELRLERVRGMFAEMEGTTLEHGVSMQVVRTGLRFVTENLGQENAFAGSEGLDDQCGTCVPLVVQDNPIGALWMVRPVPFHEPELRLLTAVADMAATAIHRAALFEKLQEQALQVQRIMDTVGDGLLLLDREQNVLLANPAAEAHLKLLNGWDDSTLVGRQLQQLGGERLATLLSKAVEQTFTLLSEDIERREFELSGHPVVEETGASGWVLVLRDVTEARRALEINQQQERLAAVGQLAAGVAHDFNNVMSAIVLYAQILQRRPDLTDKERQRLNVIYSQANHAINLIRQILDFSRRSVMERSAMDVAPFFKEMFKLWERTLPENLALSLRYDESEYIVHADPTRLQQAMTNLVINARDAMPDGGSLDVQLSRFTLERGAPPPTPDMSPGTWLSVAITDSGSGMTEEVQHRIFEPFFTTKPPGKGTGLGLSQVYGIIRQHEGFITVDSRVDGGTTFTIYLPMLEEPAYWIDADVPEIELLETAPEEATVLVVEDEEATRLAVVETLRALGYDVLAAEDGQVALRLFQAQADNIDLVISDLVMPELGGLQLFQTLMNEYPEMKMIIMSGYPLEDEGRSLLEQGIVDWIQKPFSISDLAAKVAEILRR